MLSVLGHHIILASETLGVAHVDNLLFIIPSQPRDVSTAGAIMISAIICAGKVTLRTICLISYLAHFIISGTILKTKKLVCRSNDTKTFTHANRNNIDNSAY
jgi:hypothetical protein